MSVLVKEVIEKLRLDIVYGEPELLEKEINTADITRPGLEMTGYFDYYTPERIQLLGMKEWSYLVSMSSHNRYQVLKKKCFYLRHQQSLLLVVWWFQKKC